MKITSGFSPMLLNIFKVGPAPALLRILDRLLIRLVAHRSPETVSGYMTSLSSSPDHYYFRAQSGSRERAESVRGTVLLVLGTWTLMKKYFTPSPLRPTRIELAYSLQNERGPSEDESQRRPPTGTFHQGLQQLVVESGLLPHPNENLFAIENGNTCILKIFCLCLTNGRSVE